MTGWASGQVQVDGRVLAFRRAGAGPGVLHLHDAGADTAGAPVLSRLALDHDVVDVDLPGYGRSDPPAGLVDARAMATLLAGLVEGVGWDAAVVAGTSLGAWFALELALAAPDRVAGLVLCAAAGLHVPEDYLFALFAGGRAAHSSQRLIQAALLGRLPVAERTVEGLPPAVAAAVVAPHVQSLAAAAACSFDPYTPNPRLLGRLGGVRCPVRILWGAHDALIPVAHGRALAAAIPDARLDVLDGTGHLVPLERPLAFADAVRSLTTAGRTSGPG